MATTFHTRVQLSEAQANRIITVLYPEHYTCNGDITSKSEERHTHIVERLMLILTAPVGTEVIYDSKIGKGSAIGAATFIIDNHRLTIYRDETSTGKEIILTFLHSKAFGHLKHEFLNRFGYVLGRPLEAEA